MASLTETAKYWLVLVCGFASVTIRAMKFQLAALALSTCILVVMHMPLDAQERESIDVASLGPQVGERIPEFALPDQNGTVQTLESIMGAEGAMIVFHRSADW